MIVKVDSRLLDVSFCDLANIFVFCVCTVLNSFIIQCKYFNHYNYYIVTMKNYIVANKMLFSFYFPPDNIYIHA